MTRNATREILGSGPQSYALFGTRVIEPFPVTLEMTYAPSERSRSGSDRVLSIVNAVFQAFAIVINAGRSRSSIALMTFLFAASRADRNAGGAPPGFGPRCRNDGA